MRRFASLLLSTSVVVVAGCGSELEEFIAGFADVNMIQYAISSLISWKALTTG